MCEPQTWAKVACRWLVGRDKIKYILLLLLLVHLWGVGNLCCSAHKHKRRFSSNTFRSFSDDQQRTFDQRSTPTGPFFNSEHETDSHFQRTGELHFPQKTHAKGRELQRGREINIENVLNENDMGEIGKLPRLSIIANLTRRLASIINHVTT